MKGSKHVLIGILLLSFGSALANGAQSASSPIDRVKDQAERSVRGVLDPLLEKYCSDQCKLLTVRAQVDVAIPDEISPGFDDFDPQAASRLAPSSAVAKILMDDKIGPISQQNLIDLIRQHLETFDYPVSIETSVAHFPEPAGVASTVAALREKAARKFKDTLQQLFARYCPDQCMATDFELATETVNAEEAQYASSGEFYEDGGVAIRIKSIGSTLLIDEAVPAEVRQSILEMAKLRTGEFKNAVLTMRTTSFPATTVRNNELAWRAPDGRWIAGSESGAHSNANRMDRSESTDQKQSRSESETRNNQTSERNENTQRQERFERFEKIERVENGDAVQQDLRTITIYAGAIACLFLSLLVFIALTAFRSRAHDSSAAGPTPAPENANSSSTSQMSERITLRYQLDHLTEELLSIFSENPKVAKQVFSRVLTEEGVEVTAAYLSIFGESIVIDMLRDPSLQADLSELIEYYARTSIELTDSEKLDLLKRLHNRTVAGKLSVLGSRSSYQFDFLADMDGLQILELIRNESLTVKAIIVTQCDPQKRTAIYAQLDDDTRMKLLAELSRIDYLPRDYISNVASALKRKRRENPRLNTEALPGSDVLVSLLERSGPETQNVLIRDLERENPDSARTVKTKLVSLATLKYLRDSQLLEVVLSLRHDELLHFLKGASADISETILAKTPKDLSGDLSDELAALPVPSREEYQAIERKVINRIKVMANDGLINLAETNERMFADGRGIAAVPSSASAAVGRAS